MADGLTGDFASLALSAPFFFNGNFFFLLYLATALLQKVSKNAAIPAVDLPVGLEVAGF